MAILAFLFAFALHPPVHRYIVSFSRKTTSVYSLRRPEVYLSPRAIARRARYHIALDSTDLPVDPDYLDSLSSVGRVRIRCVCKWLNTVIVEAADPAMESRFAAFTFVSAVKEIDAPTIQLEPPAAAAAAAAEMRTPAVATSSDSAAYGAAWPQSHQLHAEALPQGGDSMVIAVMDAGFYGFRTNPLLTHVRVGAAWDFVTNAPLSDKTDLHGTQVLSILAADTPGRMVGLTPRATYLLLRTEATDFESILEEYAWAAAAAYADSAGADVCTSSLGYTISQSYADLDGRTTPIARAATLASAKGMLVVVAAGNAGGSKWNHITTPADARGALCVGAVDAHGRIASFSGPGPTSDGRVKPDLDARGVRTVVTSFEGRPIFRSGTSYACPLIAGLAARLWDAFPQLDAAEIGDCLRRSADRYPHPDNRYGYGIPNGALAYEFAKAVIRAEGGH